MHIKALAAVGVALFLLGSAIQPAAGQTHQSEVTIKAGNYVGPFTTALRKYAGDLFMRRTRAKILCVDATTADRLNKLIANPNIAEKLIVSLTKLRQACIAD